MADLSLRPLLSHSPEVDPPRQWRVLWVPTMLAVLGMLIAWAAATTGQDARRDRDTLQLHFNLAYWQNELHEAQQAHRPAAEISKLQQTVANFERAQLSPPWKYGPAKYGRQFTPWDGYRYEEIVDGGYVFHQPNASREEKESSTLPPLEPGGDPRMKNVVWYPLYPLLGWIVSRTLHISSTIALTAVSWICCILGAMVMFLFAQRHYYNRMPTLDLGKEGAAAVEAHPSRRWDLTPQDTAAMWAVAALLFGPCSIFLYANFTESLFVLLLAAFLYCIQGRWWWRAALVAAFASACRSQGVLFGPILALTYLLRSGEKDAAKKILIAFGLGVISAIGLGCYMLFLNQKFHDPLAFMHGQKYWNVGLDLSRIQYALNPTHAMTRVLYYGFFSGPVDWPRLWEALCLIWPPIMLLVLGGRYLSFELEIVGWILWGLPYVSNSLAGNPPMDTQWMSMGRFMGVMIPAHIILGAIFVRLRWVGVGFLVLWASAFAIFALKYGGGAWVG